MTVSPDIGIAFPRGPEQWTDPFGRTRPELARLASGGVPGRVSVVMPCFNAESHVSQAIESVLGQDYDDIELVVVDDASDDDSLAVVRGFEDRVTVVAREQRGGACAARNDGLVRATGQWILFLDADDLLLPNVIGPLVASSEPGMTVFGEFLELRERLRPVTSSRMRGWGTMEPLEFMLRKGLPVFGPLHEREGVYRVGGFDEALRQAQEKDLHIRLALYGVDFRATGLPSAVQRMHDSPSRLSNCDWTRSDPQRHLNLSLHWLGLVSRSVPADRIAHYRTVTADRLLDAARRAVDWGSPALGRDYVEAIVGFFPEYHFGWVARLAGGPGTALGQAVILRTTALQRLGRALAGAGKSAGLRLVSAVRGGVKR